MEASVHDFDIGAPLDLRRQPPVTHTLTNDQYSIGGNYALFATISRQRTNLQMSGRQIPWPLGTSLSTVCHGNAQLLDEQLYGTDRRQHHHAGPPSTPTFQDFTQKSSQLNAAGPTSQTVLFSSDVNPANICTPAFGVDMTLNHWIHYPSGLHNRRGVMAFADGHVEVHHWLNNLTPAGPCPAGAPTSAILTVRLATRPPCWVVAAPDDC